MVGRVPTAGSGAIVKAAVGGWEVGGHAAMVGVNADALVQPVPEALRSSIVMRYWVPQYSPPTVSEFCVMLPIVAEGYALADADSAPIAPMSERMNVLVLTASRFAASVTRSVTVRVPSGPVYVKLALVPVPI